jgi:hypothetical protein
MAQAKKPTQAVAIVTGMSTVDILKKLDNEYEKLQRIQSTQWKTNGEFGDGFPNIKTNPSAVSESELISMEAVAFSRDKFYNEAAARMGKVKYPAYQINGSDYEAWHHDIKLCDAITQQEAKFKKLEEYKNKMSKFLSEADQKAALESEINDFLETM